MNRQLNRLALVSVLLLVALVVATTYWQAWASAGLQSRQDNAIQRVVQFTIQRGLILTGPKAIFAANKRRKLNGQTLFFRRYPQHKLAAQTIGYSTAARSQAGLERVDERLPHGVEHEPEQRVQAGTRQARRRNGEGEQPAAHVAPVRTAHRAAAARHQVRRGRRDERPHRSGVRHGVDADATTRIRSTSERLREACSGFAATAARASRC